MSQNARIMDLIGKRNILKQELRDVEYSLCEAVMNYEGTVQEALRTGLLRLNFAAPAGFKRALLDDRR